jgi:hypothetical protein
LLQPRPSPEKLSPAEVPLNGARSAFW